MQIDEHRRLERGNAEPEYEAPSPALSHKSYQVLDKAPSIFHFIMEGFNMFFLCFFCAFCSQIARGRRPTLTLTLTQTQTQTLSQARAPTRARLRRAFRFGKTDEKCADHLEH